MLRKKDDLSWYARKAAGQHPAPEKAAAPSPLVLELLECLKAAGVKGSFKTRTLFIRRLPPGCRGCLQGKGTNLYATGLCTRECFFCFNEHPRKDEMVVHGFPVKTPEAAAEVVERFQLSSVGISGGEPLLKPERVLGILRALRKLPRRLRIDLYTNGDKATVELLRRLKEAGLDSVRLNLAAGGFDLRPVKRALQVFEETTVEVPVFPEALDDLKGMALDLDRIGAPFLILHELFSCRDNEPGVRARGHKAAGSQPEHLLWRPVEGAEEAVLELLLFCLERTKRLSAYYCSCLTQDAIAQRGLARRRRLKA
ncbi:MAG TPA: hypothetical protein DCM05_12505 [Elusimicrobia bacterium]|nr:hypothetical protein [Elusimicrobiota bacterium]